LKRGKKRKNRIRKELKIGEKTIKMKIRIKWIMRIIRMKQMRV
jgi:hypothetical protein